MKGELGGVHPFHTLLQLNCNSSMSDWCLIPSLTKLFTDGHYRLPPNPVHQQLKLEQDQKRRLRDLILRGKNKET
ncbi:hypothetical protein TIFTF001_005935 [Ficus carica]|uniref:Uncharacterized protein n=1 Tax=Ficus carica TaxID=3494 RepID=A0AA88D014_FICCA|nr:hypothetical protein TIFTF001_005935 [Ficus carica]